MGGTFDPIHKGHLYIADSALKEYGLDRIWLMPAGDPYFKKDSNVTPAAVRLELTTECAKQLGSQYEVSDFEVKKSGSTYTAETLVSLNELYPEHEFYFIVGADSLMSLDNWYHPEIILANAVLLCAGRDNVDIESKSAELMSKYASSGADIRLIHINEMDISSTEVRSMVRNGEDISAYVTEPVEDFIKEHGLYRS